MPRCWGLLHTRAGRQQSKMTVPSLEIGMERFWEQVFHKAVPVFMCVSSSYAMRCKEPHATWTGLGTCGGRFGV